MGYSSSFPFPVTCFPRGLEGGSGAEVAERGLVDRVPARRGSVWGLEGGSLGRGGWCVCGEGAGEGEGDGVEEVGGQGRSWLKGGWM